MLLNCNSSLKVPPLLSYDLSNLDVILLLFHLLALLLTFCLALSPNLTTALLFLYNFRRYHNKRELSGSHDL